MVEFIIIKSGLFLNIIGTVMIAFSVGPNREKANQPRKGKPEYLAAILRPKMFWYGIFLLGFGFLLSILDSFLLELAIGSPYSQS